MTTEVSDNVVCEEKTVFHTKLIEFNEKINDMVKQMKELLAYGKLLDKEFNVVSKQLTKLKKTKKKSSSRPLSGFAIPTRLSDELYEFLIIQKDTLIARKDVTKMMNEYLIKNDCRDKNDQRRIIPNEELQKLFNCKRIATI